MEKKKISELNHSNFRLKLRLRKKTQKTHMKRRLEE